MKNLIIIGAGGMGRTMYNNALESIGYGEKFIIKGFIDDEVNALNGFVGYPPILGTLRNYVPKLGDIFISSIGGMSRRSCSESIMQKQVEFINLIHKTARLHNNVKLGIGNFVGAYSAIGNDVEIGDFNMIQSYVVIGHDVKMGNWNRIDTHVTCVGGVLIEDEIDIHTSAVINHGVVLCSKARVAALSFVIRKVLPGTTVSGNPAKKIVF